MVSYFRNVFLIIFISSNWTVCLGQDYRQSLNIETPNSLNFINIDGKLTSYYEIYLTNFSTDNLRLKQLNVIDSNDNTVYLKLENNSLQNSFSKITVDKNTDVLLSAGGTAIIYIQLILND